MLQCLIGIVLGITQLKQQFILNGLLNKCRRLALPDFVNNCIDLLEVALFVLLIGFIYCICYLCMYLFDSWPERKSN